MKSTKTSAHEGHQGHITLTEPLLGSANENSVVGETPRQCRCLETILWLPMAVWGNGVACMNVAVLVSSLLWLLIRVVSKTEIPVMQVVFARSLVGVTVTVAFASIMGISPLCGNSGVWGLLIMRGVCGATSMIFVFSSVFMLPMGDSTALFMLSSTLVALFSWLLRWEKSNLLIVFGALSCSSGAIVVSHPPFLFGGHKDWNMERMVGVVFSLAGAIFASFAYMAMGRIGRATSTVAITMWLQGTSCIFSITLLAFQFPKPPVLNISLEEGLLLVGLGLTSMTGQIFLTRGYQLCHATKGAAIQTTSVVYTYALGFLVLHEPITLMSTLGSIMLGVGVIIVADGKRRAKAPGPGRQQEIEEDCIT